MSNGTITFLPWIRFGMSNKIPNSDYIINSGTATSDKRAKINIKLNLKRYKVDNTDDTEEIAKVLELISAGEVLSLNQEEVIKVNPSAGEREFDFNHLAFIEFKAPDLPWRYTPAAPTLPEPGKSDSYLRIRPWLTLIVLKENEFSRLPFNGYCCPIELTNDGKQPGIFPPHDQMWAWAHVHVNKELEETNIEDKELELKQLYENDKSVAYSRLICPKRLEKATEYHAFLVPTFEAGRLIGLKRSYSGGGLDPAWQYASSLLTTISNDFVYPVYYEWTFQTSDSASFESLARRIKPSVIAEANPFSINISSAHPILAGVAPVLAKPDIEAPTILALTDQQPPEEWDLEQNQFVTKLQDYLNTSQNNLISPNLVGDPVISPPMYGRWHARVNSLDSPSTGYASDLNWIHELNLDPRFRLMAGIGVELIKKHQETLMQKAWQDIKHVMDLNKGIRMMQLSLQTFSQQYKNRFINPTVDGAVYVETVGSNIAKICLNSEQSAKTVYYDMANSSIPAGCFNWKTSALMASGSKLARAFSYNNPIGATQGWFNSVCNETSKFCLPFEAPDGMGVLTVLSRTQLTDTYVNSISAKNNFVLTVPGTPNVPLFATGTDNDQADYSRNVLAEGNNECFEVIFDNPPPQPPPAPDINIAATNIDLNINPSTAILKDVSLAYDVKSGGQNYVFQNIDLVLATPRIDVPVYEHFYEIAPEFFSTDLSSTLKNNTVGIFSINQKALEAFMAGLNFEMSRELLWRGYPTDQRGTIFKSFWKGIATDYSDIKPIHQWKGTSSLNKLGENNSGSSNGDHLVFAIRADLLRKFPRPIVVLRKATMAGTPPTLQPSNVNSDEVFPDFFAFINNDVLFIGFANITKEMLVGDGTTNNYGYYLMICESPSGVRFGLDDFQGTTPINDWNNLHWGILDSSNNAKYINATLNIADPDERYFASWNRSSGDFATILFRAQAKIAIHSKVLFD